VVRNRDAGPWWPARKMEKCSTWNILWLPYCTCERMHMMRNWLCPLLFAWGELSPWESGHHLPFENLEGWIARKERSCRTRSGRQRSRKPALSEVEGDPYGRKWSRALLGVPSGD